METEPNHEKYHCDLDGDDGRVEARTFFYADGENCRNYQRNDERRNIDPNFMSEQVRRSQQIVSSLYEFRRLRTHDVRYFRQESLSSRHKCGIRCLCHLASDDVLRRAKPGPTVVGQPQRHLDMENIEQFYEVIRPS